jgi:hypothetical protein
MQQKMYSWKYTHIYCNIISMLRLVLTSLQKVSLVLPQNMYFMVIVNILPQLHYVVIIIAYCEFSMC